MALKNITYSGMTLKALLENPDLQHAPAVFSAGIKDKKESDGARDIDFTAAFLGPHLWDKTYSANDFNLEYMDLDEFLSENDIPVIDTPGLDQLVTSPDTPPPSQSPILQASPSCGPMPSPSPSMGMNPPTPLVAVGSTPVTVLPVRVMSAASVVVKPEIEKDVISIHEGQATSPQSVATGSPPPINPLPVKVDFQLTEQDIALISVPGQGAFNPATHSFADDELKPQPMIKKSKKVFVPEDLKDEKYWARRNKNNHAAKRSRDARRVKENQIAMRAAYLEKENSTLKEELDKVRKENAGLRHRLSKYEPAVSTP